MTANEVTLNVKNFSFVALIVGEILIGTCEGYLFTSSLPTK